MALDTASTMLRLLYITEESLDVSTSSNEDAMHQVCNGPQLDSADPEAIERVDNDEDDCDA